MISSPPPHEQASASSSSSGPIASKEAAQRESLQKSLARTIIAMRMLAYPDGMRRITLSAVAAAAMVALALPASAAGPSSWQAGSGPAGPFTVLRSVDPHVALAGGLAGAVAVTRDGGKTWSATSAPSGADVVDLAAANATTIFELDSRGLLHRSTDGGATWSTPALPSGTHAVALRVFGGSRLLVVGRRALLVSSDGGDSFRDVTPKLARTDLFRGADVAAGAPLVWGAHALLVSPDGGRHWQHLKLPHLGHGDGVLAVDFIAPRVGFVLTSFRRFYRTTNAGHHWGEMLGTAGAGADVAFSDRRNGWLAAPGFANRFDGYALHTTDGGVTWRPQAVATRFLSHVASARGTAYAIGDEGTRLYSTGGGESGRAITIGFRPVPRVARRGGSVRIRGRVNPALRGVGVAVSMRSQGRWIVRWVHTHARGVFTASFTVQKTAAFVAQVPAVDGHGSAATKPVAVRVPR